MKSTNSQASVAGEFPSGRTPVLKQAGRDGGRLGMIPAKAHLLARLAILSSLIGLVLLVLPGRFTFAEDLLEIATQAYIYGYPLVTMDMTRRALTNVAEPGAGRAPMGQFARLRSYPA